MAELTKPAFGALCNGYAFDQVVPERWQPKVFIKPDTGCWEWTGSKNNKGYARLSVGGRAWAAHRYTYERAKGPIPSGLEVDHLCRNRACMNPAHLEAVTGRVNILRGMGPTALNARKTHCKRGHLLTGDNLRLQGPNKLQRSCRTCEILRGAAKYEGGKRRKRKVEKGPPAPHVHKTHCTNGHDYSPENTYMFKGRQKCRVCNAAASAAYAKRLKVNDHRAGVGI